MPEITVLMPVRNGALYIKEAIDSVLAQSFEDFELLIIDDGSEDDSVQIIEMYTDPRIRLQKKEAGFIKNLNEGIFLAQGNFIARMDADDIMHPERLRIQLKRMKKNGDIALCASWFKNFRSNGDYLPPTNIGEGYIMNPILKMLKGNFIAHPTVMLDKSFLEKHNLHYREYTCAEDFKLWFEVAGCGGKIFIEPQQLMSLRKSDSQVSVIKRNEMEEQTIRIKQEVIQYLLRQMKGDRLLKKIYSTLEEAAKKELIPKELIPQVFYNIFFKKLS